MKDFVLYLWHLQEADKNQRERVFKGALPTLFQGSLFFYPFPFRASLPFSPDELVYLWALSLLGICPLACKKL
jgi:hypothetical protein